MSTPQTPKEHAFYGFGTVFFTVLAFTLYNNLYIPTTTSSTLGTAINEGHGVLFFGTFTHISVMLGFVFIVALASEMLFAGKFAHKIADKMVNSDTKIPFISQTAMTVSIIFIMAPWMSLILSFALYDYQSGFNIITWFQSYFILLCRNLPFVFFAQLFFIQPLMRWIFQKIFRTKNISTTK